MIAKELKAYQKERNIGNTNAAFQNLERIHILSQPYPMAHTIIHLRMLALAIKSFKSFEIVVQFFYSMFSFKFSLFNIFPFGNTGRANAILKGKMPIPHDLLISIDNKDSQ